MIPAQAIMRTSRLIELYQVIDDGDQFVIVDRVMGRREEFETEEDSLAKLLAVIADEMKNRVGESLMARRITKKNKKRAKS